MGSINALCRSEQCKNIHGLHVTTKHLAADVHPIVEAIYTCASIDFVLTAYSRPFKLDMKRSFKRKFGTCWSSAGRSFVMRSLNPCPENFDQIVVVWVNYQSLWGGGGGKLPIVIPSTTNTILHVSLKNEEYPNVKYPNLPTTNDRFWGGGGKLPTQIVNTKLPNENIQTYQLQMIKSGGGGGKVNYQMKIVNTKLPNENIQTYQL